MSFPVCHLGASTVLLSLLTAICASSLLLIDAPVRRVVGASNAQWRAFGSQIGLSQQSCHTCHRLNLHGPFARPDAPAPRRRPLERERLRAAIKDTRR